MLNSVYFEENWSDRNVNFVLLKQMVMWQKFYSPYLSAINQKPRLVRGFCLMMRRVGIWTLGRGVRLPAKGGREHAGERSERAPVQLKRSAE